MGTDDVRQDNIFVVGCQRSGTSVIWASLIAHPDLKPMRGYDPETGYDPKELYYFFNIFESRKRFDSPLYGWDVDREYLSELVDLTVRHCAKHHGASDGRWLSAKPLDGLHVRELTEAMPEAKIVFVMRHPQEVVWSSAHAPWTQTGKETLGELAERGARHWQGFARTAIDILQNRYDGNVLLVRHEDVIAQPGRVAATLTEHVGVSNSPRVEEQLTAPTFNSSFENGRNPVELIPKIRQAISNEEEFCSIIMAVASEEMAELGYGDLRESPVDDDSVSSASDESAMAPARPPSLRTRALLAEAAHASAQSRIVELQERVESAEAAHSLAQERIVRQLKALDVLNLQMLKAKEELSVARLDAQREVRTNQVLSDRITRLEVELAQANLQLESHLQVVREWLKVPGKLR